MVAVGGGRRGEDDVGPGESLAEALGGIAAGLVPVAEVAQLDREDRCLEGVEPVGPGGQLMVVAGLSPCVRSSRTFASSSASSVTSAPPSPQPPRFLVG